MHKRKANRVHRACFSCRKRKQGCDEQRPCKRCTEKGVECTEVEIKRKRQFDKQGNAYASDDEEIYSDCDSIIEDEEHHDHNHADGESCCDDSDSGLDANVEGFESESEGERKISPRAAAVKEKRASRLRSSSNITMPKIKYTRERPITPPSGQEDELEESGKKRKRSNIGLLLPFLSSHMEDFHSSFSFYSSESEDGEVSSDEEELTSLSKSLFGGDFPFSSVDSDDSLRKELNQRIPKDFEIDGLYRDMWIQFLGQAKDDESLRRDFLKIKSTWSEIMKCLRSLEWEKLYSYLQEMGAPSGLEENGQAVVIWSSGGRIQYANPSFCRMLGFTADELKTAGESRKIPSAHYLFHPEESVKISQKQLESLESPGQSSYFQSKTRLLSKLRKEIPVSASISNVRDNFGMPLLTVAHFSPIAV
eukprot:TRINITY_DN1549_c0_g1_i1.p1 TRINITY_DN1549_c0_g1~~TRINITY_DN1549_c0_g1_i1.p1  ORF type:complete len:421 (+),score=116.63 TRINITY_DN1549_c0_g1_i1:598-1860(+)